MTAGVFLHWLITIRMQQDDVASRRGDSRGSCSFPAFDAHTFDAVVSMGSDVRPFRFVVGVTGTEDVCSCHDVQIHFVRYTLYLPRENARYFITGVVLTNCRSVKLRDNVVNPFVIRRTRAFRRVPALGLWNIVRPLPYAAMSPPLPNGRSLEIVRRAAFRRTIPPTCLAIRRVGARRREIQAAFPNVLCYPAFLWPTFVPLRALRVTLREIVICVDPMGVSEVQSSFFSGAIVVPVVPLLHLPGALTHRARFFW